MAVNMKQVKHLTGSRAFFDGMEGFNPKDTDWVIFGDNIPCNIQISINGEDIYKWKYNNIDDILNYLLNKKILENEVGMFLVPEIIDKLGMTFDKLPQLKPLIDKLDDRHKYIEVIYNAYLENGKFELTKEQLDSAYEEYKRERPNVYNK